MSAPDLKAPPCTPDIWTFRYNTLVRVQSFTEKTWFTARAKACAFFGCEPSDVVCVGRPV